MQSHFLRPFGQPLANPMMDRRMDENTEADIHMLLKFCGDWQSERDLMKATGIGLRRMRTALLTAAARKVIEARTRRVKNRANSHEEYRKVEP